ncbi:hypothetical protein HP15_p187g23 (plasmid) [Marinobacter adhaerens HP15]|uniref:Uncharacterized protein n=1 Tax=Marinobacter adhaerens (strain DSM 23420 / HP15) TaxID=225937 RepID=E4PRY5_MARAH|nr:hypothetical protein HP15_p187g23 [Marinobacter adhaerens HP15]
MECEIAKWQGKLNTDAVLDLWRYRMKSGTEPVTQIIPVTSGGIGNDYYRR